MTAEAWPFTVMASSGIFLRAEPSKTGKRLLSLPFGSLVYETAYSENYFQFSEIDTTVIEGIRGHWIRVKSNSTEGYVFSGFVLAGEWILPSERGLNKDYQLLRSGSQWTGMVYDPTLNWYAFDQKGNNRTFKKVNITLQTWHSYPEADLEMYDASENPLKILVDGRDTLCWLLGSKEEIPKTSNTFSFSTSDALASFSFDNGMFFYPEQNLSFYFDANEFQIGGKEAVILNRSQADGYKREYKLVYRRIDHNYPNPQGTYEYDLSNELQLEGTAAEQSQYHTPSLLWIGDINGDHELDFILLTGPAHESNEGGESYILFISDKTSGKWLRQVAKYSIYYYDNC